MSRRNMFDPPVVGGDRFYVARFVGEVDGPPTPFDWDFSEPLTLRTAKRRAEEMSEWCPSVLVVSQAVRDRYPSKDEYAMQEVVEADVAEIAKQRKGGGE